MIRQLLRLSAISRYDEDIISSEVVSSKCDPFAVGREFGVSFISMMDSQSHGASAALLYQP
jgi:hypothetical protein